MARLPYAELSDPAIAPLANQIRAERGSILHLYQMLLHSPPIAGGWLNYLTAVRQKNPLPGDLRELVIVRVAILNRAPYEAQQHAPLALKEGVTQEQLDQLEHWRDSSAYTSTQRAVLAYTDSMTRDIQVPDEIFNEVANCFPSDQLVALTATVAAYNMVSRFLEALQVHADDQR